MTEHVPAPCSNDATIISISPSLMEKLSPDLIARYGTIMQGGSASLEDVERIRAELDAIEAAHDVNNREYLEAAYPDELLAKATMMIPGSTPEEQRRYICDVLVPRAAEKVRRCLDRASLPA